jgi:hypothetical protein
MCVLLTFLFMRLWSVHPRYFDRQALTACWREALLAQAVLAGQTRGYSRHPQLKRFQDHPSPLTAIGGFLRGIVDEADVRRYSFNRTKILVAETTVEMILVTRGQLLYEWMHLQAKLAYRSPVVAARWQSISLPDPHPLFTVIEGQIASWERSKEHAQESSSGLHQLKMNHPGYGEVS